MQCSPHALKSISKPLVNNKDNRILAALPPEDYGRISQHLEPVELELGQILYDAGGLMEHVYFPARSMISLVSYTSEGTGVEVGVTGFEGMTGVSLVLGDDRAPHETMVQVHDGAMRMSAKALLEEFERGGALQKLLLRYTQSLLIQISQVVACNRLHSIEERLARWLLMTHDRSMRDDLPLTHEFIAMMLGVRRAGVTTAAISLQTEGFISYRRGSIKIIDRQGLEDFTCECYRIVKAEFDRLPG